MITDAGKGQVSRAVERLRFLPTQLLDTTMTGNTDWEDLLVWLHQGSFPPHHLVLTQFPDGTRGLAATKDILAEEALVTIPSQLLLTKDRVLSTLSEEGKRMVSSVPAQALIGAYLAIERGKGSRSAWNPYIRLLPSAYPTIPLLYTTRLRSLLPYAILQKVKKQEGQIQDAYQIIGKISEWKLISKDDFIWGWLTVNTRCVYLDEGEMDVEDRLAVAPFLDMLNHDPTTSVSGKMDASKDAYIIRTHRSIRAGDQAYISYGPHDNAFLLAEEARMRALKETAFYGDYSLHPGEMSYRLEITLYLWALPSGPKFPSSLILWQNLVEGMVGEEALGNETQRRMRAFAHQVAGLVLSQATTRLNTLTEMCRTS
ncbi:hypothetical protein BJ684DRAFT_19868 [Piptocephalis cylindrospora]|uniref:SET domain-containing protein n=1 Tax=Piptocephalis cylindrospora TaxID=1907219 RepID=A0A4P9Y603_9FUNG|nr:hypothetical protein BJ684DRAFT_19868 [Piptocephalis cylindrospora]|eukprot:RKP13661.1 hypothetical protein BJ684DRAFT_19868 [Piptocephalis cylindrospora]